VAKPSPNDSPSTPARPSGNLALFNGLGAYTLWGVFPLYFRAVAHVPPWVVLCHRIVWSIALLVAVITYRREWPLIFRSASSRRNLVLLSAGSVLIALNWLIFIYAVGSRQVLQASMGYFINPLFSIALGMVFLHERLRPLQWAAVVVAIASVAQLAITGSGLPWVALSLAVTFGLYGLVRKKLDMNSLHGLTLETAILFPIAGAALWFMPEAKIAPGDVALLSLSGIITAVPLLMFGAAVRGLKLSTIGFLQYIGPTLQFLIAIFVMGEPLNLSRLTGFIICWCAIALYVLDSILHHMPTPVADEPE
jgi:chloramphenicol-sensitive protein RarD